MGLSLIEYKVGGQFTPYVDLAVQSGDLIWALGSDSGGDCRLNAYNVNTNLLADFCRRADSSYGAVLLPGPPGHMRTKIWKALGGGILRVKIGGTGGNWDLLAVVMRPSVKRNWQPQVVSISHYEMDHQNKHLLFDVQDGTWLFVLHYGQRHGITDPTFSGITYTKHIDVLPEGSTWRGNSRMYVLEVTHGGQADFWAHYGAFMVTWVTPGMAPRRRSHNGFVLV